MGNHEPVSPTHSPRPYLRVDILELQQSLLINVTYDPQLGDRFQGFFLQNVIFVDST